MKTIPLIGPADEWLACQRAARRDLPFFAFYSSLIEAIVTEPALMVVAVDDHLTHRGDGVFESLKCVG
ncbi:MAG: hypothetical protein K9N49_10840, partial [Candidatus Marinimicrobia bacterium]|nr:hypothetical protein [Candidatus Neomarinimicrobiota bacterium]